MENNQLKDFLNRKVDEYNQPSFIEKDPISIPHSFTKKQDIEIAGFFAALFSWGSRTIIINKSKELMQLMHHRPHEFVLNHTDKDLKGLLNFKHRTFNATDILYFVHFPQHHYRKHASLENAFLQGLQQNENIENALNYFYTYFFSLEDVPARSRKHIAAPSKKSNCKRLNMFLRWMVRNDNKGVDFGIWKNILPAQLICPVDVHVARVARRFNMLQRKQTDWQAAKELTEYLRTLDAEDPVKYDYALFGLGVMEKYT